MKITNVCLCDDRVRLYSEQDSDIAKYQRKKWWDGEMGDIVLSV